MTKIRSKNTTTFGLINRHMHTSEQGEATANLFDAMIEIIEKPIDGERRKVLRIRWMHGIEAPDKEFTLAGFDANSVGGVLEGLFSKPQNRWQN